MDPLGDFMPHNSVFTKAFNHIINRGHKIRVPGRKPLTCMPRFHLRSSQPHQRKTHQNRGLSARKAPVDLSDDPFPVSLTDEFIGSLICCFEPSGFKRS